MSTKATFDPLRREATSPEAPPFIYCSAKNFVNIPDIVVGFDISQKRKLRFIHFPFRSRLPNVNIHEAQD